MLKITLIIGTENKRFLCKSLKKSSEGNILYIHLRKKNIKIKNLLPFDKDQKEDEQKNDIKMKKDPQHNQHNIRIING